jgi:phosphohistidine phosphatase
MQRSDLMKKELIIYRHAKSDWDAGVAVDHDRPINAKGIASAKVMGKLLAMGDQIPELIICSSALRAQQTLENSMELGSWDSVVETQGCLYDESTHHIFTSQVCNRSDDIHRIMLVGHEPKCSALTSQLIGGGEVQFSTATMAKIVFNVSRWSDIHYGMGVLRWLHHPSFFEKW